MHSLISSRRLLPLTLLTLALPLLAQQGAVVFKHFHRYPASGQWTTQATVTVNGKPMGAPVTSTTCASPLSAPRRAEMIKTGNDAAPSCNINILRDEERTAEYEQVCTVPAQTIHSTLHAIDDSTLAIDVRSAIGSNETIMKSTVHLVGACTAAQEAEARAAAAAPLPSMKPDAQACAEFASSRQQAEDALKRCESGDFAESERASCRSTMAGLLKHVQMVQKSCGN